MTKIFNESTEDENLRAVQRDAFAIQHIENPSEAVQLEAVKQNVYAIGYIKKPSEAVQLQTVKKNGWFIRHIKNPTEAVQLEAVRRNGSAIEYIENPSEAVQLEAVREVGRSIRHIENPTEAVQLEVVREDVDALWYIKNPTEAVKLEAVRSNGDAIKYIKNPSFEVVKALETSLFVELLIKEELQLNIKTLMQYRELKSDFDDFLEDSEVTEGILQVPLYLKNHGIQKIEDLQEEDYRNLEDILKPETAQELLILLTGCTEEEINILKRTQEL